MDEDDNITLVLYQKKKFCKPSIYLEFPVSHKHARREDKKKTRLSSWLSIHTRSWSAVALAADGVVVGAVIGAVVVGEH